MAISILNLFSKHYVITIFLLLYLCLYQFHSVISRKI